MKILAKILGGLWAFVAGIFGLIFVLSLIFDFLVWIGIGAMVRIDAFIKDYLLSKGDLIIPVNFSEFWQWSNLWNILLSLALFIVVLFAILLIKHFTDPEEETLKHGVTIAVGVILVAQVVLISVGVWHIPSILRYFNLALLFNLMSLDQIAES